jgi:hypothetical protein
MAESQVQERIDYAVSEIHRIAASDAYSPHETVPFTYREVVALSTELHRLHNLEKAKELPIHNLDPAGRIVEAIDALTTQMENLIQVLKP